jgi:hypothetical protein
VRLGTAAEEDRLEKSNNDTAEAAPQFSHSLSSRTDGPIPLERFPTSVPKAIEVRNKITNIIATKPGTFPRSHDEIPAPAKREGA